MTTRGNWNGVLQFPSSPNARGNDRMTANNNKNLKFGPCIDITIFSTRSLNGVGPDRPLMFRSPPALHQQTNYVNDTRVSFILPKNRLLTVCLITSSYRFNMASVMPPPLPKPATTTDAPISIKLKRKADDLSNPESYPNDDEVSFVACILNQ